MMEAETEAYDVSIGALRYKTRSLLSAMLNPILCIPTDEGLCRYWRGLGQLCEIKPQYEANLQTGSDPTGKILDLWYEQDPQHRTIRQFLSFLERMDRFDVIDDTKELIDEDIRVFKKGPKLVNLSGDKSVITIDDITRSNEGRELEHYDAFVLYGDEDIQFATELIKHMEDGYGMKLCCKDRDLLCGGLEYEKMITLIMHRCNRLIVILSDSFFSSAANKFYVMFAESYGIMTERKLVPVVYKDCNLPSNMKNLFTIDYRRNVVWDFWGRLKAALSIIDPVTAAVTRSKSDKSQAVKSALHETHAIGLRPLNQGVTFSSVGNLNNMEKIIADPPPLNSSISADSLSALPGNNTKPKKNNWFKNILTKGKIKNDGKRDKEKPKGFHRHNKRKAAAAAN